MKTGEIKWKQGKRTEKYGKKNIIHIETIKCLWNAKADKLGEMTENNSWIARLLTRSQPYTYAEDKLTRKFKQVTKKNIGV